MIKVDDEVKKESKVQIEEAPVTPAAPTVPWKMPRPYKGQQVIFYYRGTVSERNSEVGFITSVGERVVTVSHRGNAYDNVFHVDDPRLVDNPRLRTDIDGVWEFTKGDELLNDRINALEAKVKELETLIK